MTEFVLSVLIVTGFAVLECSRCLYCRSGGYECQALGPGDWKVSNFTCSVMYNSKLLIDIVLSILSSRLLILRVVEAILVLFRTARICFRLGVN